MNDSILNRFMTSGSTLQELLPVAVIFMIVWCMVWVAFQQMDMFPKRVSVVLSICVTLLGLIGIKENQLEWICQHYAAMAIAMLVTLATAVRFFWKKTVDEKTKEK